MNNTMKAHRDTISVCDAEIMDHNAFDGDQYIMRVMAPEIAASATPGSFAHIQVNEFRLMRRPISIMRVDAKQGWVDFLYKVLGEGTQLLSQRKVGEKISIMGPIGHGFIPTSSQKRPLLIGGGVGMPPMVFLADALRTQLDNYTPFVILGSEVPFPFQSKPSTLMLPGMPDGVIACMPLLEDWGIASRLTSTQSYAGCHDGYVTDLARRYIEALDAEQRQQLEIFSCGPHVMLEAVAKLAAEFDIPCQVSLEEFMACAVGGCAGCTVPHTENGQTSMKRVCVDGPVFDAQNIF